MSEKPIVRFAPSPTGELHLGGARTALFNYLYAKKNNGKFFLRIEDTDPERSKDEFIDQICDSLNWIGLDWDEPIIYQSQNKSQHSQIVNHLLKTKKAYRCFCTKTELQKERDEAKKAKIPYKYSGKYRNLSDNEVKQKLNNAEPFSIRIKIPNGETSFTDMVYGEIKVNNKDLDDFIIQRSDGSPTFNLSCVVDDLFMGINTVIRGEDHLSNTPKQIIIYNLLSKKPPKFVHLPMILASKGQRLSKRHGATGVEEYKNMGYFPESLLNYLFLLGWSSSNEKEIFNLNEMIHEFNFDGIVKKGAIFDIKKLEWVSGQHLSIKSPKDFLELIYEINSNWGLSQSEQYLFKVIDILKSRVRTINDIISYSDYFFNDPKKFDSDVMKRSWPDSQTNRYIEKYYNVLKGVDDWSFSNLENQLKTFSNNENISIGKIILPIRLSISGFGIGPSLYALMELLTKKTVLRRIKYAIDNFPIGL
ncbi:MAG: glutamate--tRNA ligase [Candidatus Marinimicrobia bacterium]|nr:glutamate--tRNA ligase [Candidatus Neomarinimicrobiota bacterium]